jgi:deoxyribodipyrimidine photolyase
VQVVAQPPVQALSRRTLAAALASTGTCESLMPMLRIRAGICADEDDARRGSMRNAKRFLDCVAAADCEVSTALAQRVQLLARFLPAAERESAHGNARPPQPRPRVDRRRRRARGLGRGTHGLPDCRCSDAAASRRGWVHNRGRLLVASFLTKTLGIDWRQGAKVFLELLVDGDVANNVGNWQWVAGTGVDSRPNRVFNPIALAKRLDPQGKYVRAHVPELGELKGSAIHEPWRAPLAARAPEYPERIVDLEHRAARA